MADKLIFPIGFDLEAAVKEAQGNAPKLLRKLQTTINSKPLAVNLRIDTEKGSIDEINQRMRELVKEWNALSEAQRVASKTSGEYTTEAKKIIEEYTRLTGATESYARTLQQIASAARQAANQQEKNAQAEQKAEQKRQQAISASLRAEYKRIEAKRQSEAASRRELEMLNRQYAAEERRQRLAASEASIAKRQKVINTLRAEENTIVNITAKLQHWQKVMNSSDMSGKQFKRATEEVRRLSQKLSEAQARIDRLTGKAKKAAEKQSATIRQVTTATTTATAKQSAAVRQVTNEFKNQDGYVSRLIKRLAVYAGFSAIGNFLTNIREVTAQFELQRVSLGAIIQDQTKANALFSEIKSFALKSPVSILDLTKYTKQLAAYKIGVDELFETTKKLTDVSVGLGVSMDRVVLAYGQTRATGYLRASEIRQFTEMGVPIVEELAAKLSKMNGELVTAAQVMDMVSKRAISFELVKEVFDDMTSAGGMFYNMQEKQGNTLFGLWAKLGDAASVMYDEIGNTDTVNSAMKGIIQLLTDLMKNWREVGNAMKVAGVGFAALWATKKVKGWQSNIDTARIAANERYIAASNAYRAAIQAEQAARATATSEEYRAIAAKTASAEATYAAARAEYLAARNTTLWSKAWNKLKAAFLGNWLTLLLAGLAAVAVHYYNVNEKANRLKNTLAEIKKETSTLQGQSVRNFEYLANAAVNAADGSKKQKEALDELSRTYRDMLPQEALTIENLRAMKGNYEELTKAIRENIAAQQESKAIEEVKGEYSPKIIKAQRKAEKLLSGMGYGDTEIQRFFRNIEKHYKEFSDRLRKGEKIDIMGELLNMSGIDKGAFSDKQLMKIAVAYTKLVNAQEAWIQKENAIRASYKDSTEDLGKYTKSMQNYNEWVQKNMNSGETFVQNQQNINMQIKGMESLIRQNMKLAGLAWNEEWANIVKSVNPNDLGNISSLNMEAIIAAIDPNKYPELYNYVKSFQNIYNDLVPPDPVVKQVRAKFFEIANSMGIIDKVRANMMGASENLENYRKKINDTAKDYAQQVQNLTKVLAVTPTIALAYQEIADKLANAEKLKEFYELMAEILGKTTSGGRGTQSDQRLSILQEMVSTLKQVNKEYDELAKKEGATKALADTQRVYADTFKNMQQLAAKYKFDLPDFGVPTDTASLTRYLKAVKDAMAKLPKSDKAVLALQVDIEKLNIDDMQKQIEQKLKDLSDKISRTKTAKEFYDKILSQTGSYDIAGSVTMSIYGDDGQNLLRDTVEQLQMAFENVDISAAIDLTTGAIDYNMLRKFEEEYSDKLIAGRKDLRDKLISEGEKASAAQVAQWYKDIEKAKDYNQQYVDIVRETQTKIAEIRRSGLDKDREDELVRGMEEKQRKALKKLQLDEFRSSDLYVRLFEDMDSASTTMLQSLKDKLDEMKKTMREDLTPKELKSLTQDIEKLEDVLQQRNPFKTITDGLKGLRQWHKENGSLADAEKKLTDAIAEEDAARKQWEADALAAAKAQTELNAALQQYQAIVGVKGEDSEEAQTAKANADAKRAEANAANDTARNSEETYNSAKQTKEEAQETVRSWEKWVDSMREGLKVFGQIEGILSDMTDAANNFMDVFAASDETRQFFDDILGGLNSIIGGAEKAATGMLDAYAGFMSANPMQMIQGGMSAISGLSSIAKGVTDIFYAGRIKRANKEIERQQELLDQLEYTYGRLEKAAEKVFGADYIRNYNQQQKNLQAQAAAYQKQAEAERSKGKKADKDKIKEYENAARDTANEIKKMQEDLTAHFTGTSRQDAAREFARSWLEAKATFANTADAIKSKYKDMLQSMIIEGAASRVIDNALSGLWKQMDAAYAANDPMKAIEAFANGYEKFVADADKGMEVLWNTLESRGIDLKNLLKDTDTNYTGIKRTIAGASEETMSEVATIGNTLMYYVSPIPGIAANVAMLTEHILNGGASAMPTANAGVDFAAYHTESLQHLNTLTVRTSEILAQCKELNSQTKSIADALGRVVIYKGNSHGIKVYM